MKKYKKPLVSRLFSEFPEEEAFPAIVGAAAAAIKGLTAGQLLVAGAAAGLAAGRGKGYFGKKIEPISNVIK